MRSWKALLVVALVGISSAALIVYGAFTKQVAITKRESLAFVTQSIGDVAEGWTAAALIARMTPAVAATLDPMQVEASVRPLRELGPMTAMGSCTGSVSVALFSFGTPGTPETFAYHCAVTYRAAGATVDLEGTKLEGIWKLTYFKVTPRPAPTPA